MSQHIHVLARGVLIKDNCILLVYDPTVGRPSYYYLPGGHVNTQESVSQALTREMEEESGYTCQIERFLGALESAWNGPNCSCHSHEINMVFKIDIPSINASTDIHQQESHVAFHWIPLNKLHSVDLRPKALIDLISQWITLDMNVAFESAFES